MTFSRAQITAALRQADQRIRMERAQAKRNRSLRDQGVDTAEGVSHLVPALLDRPLHVSKVQIALEHLGFAKASITPGVWLAIGNHAVRLDRDFILSRT